MGCAFVPQENWEIDYDNHGEPIPSDFNPQLFKMAWEAFGTRPSAKAKLLLNCELAQLEHITDKDIENIILGLITPNEVQVNILADACGVLSTFFYRKTKYVDNKSIMFACGDGIKPCTVCGNIAYWLCDYRYKDGKLCSVPLCEICAYRVGDKDYCPEHKELLPVKLL